MHTDPELLALLALGEEVGSEADREHVRSCPVCAAELAELQHVVTLARGAADLAMSDPDPRVWEAIRTEIRGVPTQSPEGAVDVRELAVHARLTPVAAGWSAATGDAELGTDAQGRRVLQVTLHADLPAAGIRQAWLLHRTDPSRRQTLGILDGRHGLWTVEHAIDLDEFGILDISQQSIGSTEHSGDTIVRGELVPAA
ncbi:hypothetical protein [Microlunatus flavus]|uniref:Uncharacterized protein n=1 Tax=Microlunatus flavus TaxID=1036181 RepID=A0A1H9IAN9_9ACTN|nr:hypothetical protein [Microlunatus flavus]SEQ71643.1 hypothetical protein SAMN05421756_105160 [Microlunatus flavus]